MTLSAEWIVGFVDGEGCFSVSVVKQPSMRFNYQVLHEFVVVQHVRDIQILEEFVKYFNCGSVARNHGDRYHYRVRDLHSIENIIIPFFDKYPLKTAKQQAFKNLKKIITIVQEKRHLTLEGLQEIRNITNIMNNRAKRVISVVNETFEAS